MPRVLVVDDERACRDSLRLLLSTYPGWEVETAPGVEEAREACRRFAADVLVVDWMLGDGACGMDLAEILRTDRPDLRVILVTGYPSAELSEAIADNSSAQCLTKPFRPGELIAAIEAATARK